MFLEFVCFLDVCVWFGLVCFWRTRRLRLRDVFVGGEFVYLYVLLLVFNFTK